MLPVEESTTQKITYYYFVLKRNVFVLVELFSIALFITSKVNIKKAHRTHVLSIPKLEHCYIYYLWKEYLPWYTSWQSRFRWGSCCSFELCIFNYWNVIFQRHDTLLCPITVSKHLSLNLSIYLNTSLKAQCNCSLFPYSPYLTIHMKFVSLIYLTCSCMT